MPGPSDLKFVHLKDFEPISTDVLETLPKTFIRQRMIVPLSKSGGRLTAAVANPDGSVKPQGLQMIAHCPVDLVLAPLDEIIEFIKTHYAEELEQSGSAPTSPSLVPVPLNALLGEAVDNRASEVIIEHSDGKVRLRQRIRGILMTDLKHRLSEKDAVVCFEAVVRQGKAQDADGNRWAEWAFDFTRQGETVHCSAVLSETKDFHMLTLHLTATKEKPFSPSGWGMGPHQERIVESLLQKRQGIVLFCGSESDDGLTHIHACAKSLSTPERHLISVENSKKDWFPGIEQLVSHGDEALFSQLLKLSFRHEPDVVVVNALEKKTDFETCLHESLKKPLVLARCFARDAAEALIQLVSMNIEPYLIGAGVLGVVAQRTIRLTCPKCQEKDPIHRERVKEMGIPIAMQPPAFYRGKGCDACSKTGFDRETCLFEVMEMSDEIRNRIGRDLKSEEIRSLLKSSGMMTFRQNAVHKAVNGQTSLTEVLRVTP